DLRKFRVKELNIDAGVSALEIKLGDKTDRQDIKIDSGLAALDIWFPRNVGCEVKVKGELNLEDFDGFENVSKGLYRTSEFSSSEKKAFLEVDAGLSKINKGNT